jgi:hypothetical protein
VTDQPRRRPLAIVQTEIDLTQTALKTCAAMSAAALRERSKLLEAGWPVGHALCEDLDAVSAQWTARWEQQRRALVELREEL